MSRALPRLWAVGDPPGYRSEPLYATGPWSRYWHGTNPRTGRERLLGAHLAPWVLFDHPDRPTLLLSHTLPGHHARHISVGDDLAGFDAAEALLAAWAHGEE